MHLPRSNKAGESPPDPSEASEADDTPLPTAFDPDSDEHSWEALGSTRVVEGEETPSSVVRAGTQPTEGGAPETKVISHAVEPDNLGEFHIVRRIGEGAMGAVYLAKQASFGREVALKVLFPHIASNPKLVERLYREGRVMGQLDHPNIVQAYGVGEDQGYHYIALEFIDGISLQKWLNKLGCLSLGDAVLVTLIVARALAYAHEQGIVHRDIKPDNVLITRLGVIKVADLGMVKIDDEDMALTQTGHAVGTPWYMPLEQAKNAKDTDGRSDIYALGCMFYCMLTGAPPFAGKTLVDVIHAKEIGTFPPVRQTNSDAPERLDLVIAKMAAKHPKYRYQSCAELIKDLESLELANARLEFLEAPLKVELTPRPDPASKSSHPDKPLDYDANIWYVRIKDPEGRVTVHKLPTAQIEKMLAEDRLPPNAKASHDPKDGFRALATYREFQGLALVKASKQAALQQTSRYHNLYRKVEEKDRLRVEQEEQAASMAPDWLALWNAHKPLAIKIGAVGGAVVLGLMLLWWIVAALWR